MNPEQAQQLVAEMQELISGDRFRNFVAQSHSRNLLRYLDSDPADWPRYTPTLDENLLYMAHLLFWNGLLLKELAEFQDFGDSFIEQGAEILEFLYAQADPDTPERVEQLVNASLGYYIAGHYARAYVLMKDPGLEAGLPQEHDLLRRLFLKDLSGFRRDIQQILVDNGYSDSTIAALVRAGIINEDEALQRALRVSLNRAFSFFVEFPKNGNRDHLDRALEIIDQGLALSENSHFVDWWWLFYCAKYLFNEFDSNSLWSQLGPLPGTGTNTSLVDRYVRANYRRSTPVLELWRSQAAALSKINDDQRRNYCVKMPTSAGKTKIAEIAILRFLLDQEHDPQAKCVYIAPFRSLAAEIEASLRQSLHPLGIRVSELYGGFELSPVERILMDQTRVLIATPEKIDAFLRYNPEFSNHVKLIIIDEGHIINSTHRGLRFEFFLHRLVCRFADGDARFLFMSAVLPNIDEFAAWIAGSPENIIESQWRPSRLMIGELRWGGRVGGIYYLYAGHHELGHECYVTNFVRRIEGESLRGTRRRNPYPNDIQEALADAALQFAQQDMTLVFVAQRRSVEPFGRVVLNALRIKDAIARHQGANGFHLPISEEGRELLEECLALARETMGDDADIIRFLEAGVVVHHSRLPQRLRLKLEELVRHQVVKLVIATTTLAQGVNFPIRTILVHSLMHGHGQALNPLDFWNICGRAGRGMNENEGQVLFLADLTETLDRRQHAQNLRLNMIQSYQTYRVTSTLRELLRAIVGYWQDAHPNIDVAQLCQLIAENNLDWAQQPTQEEIADWLDLLDSQLIALAEEQLSLACTPDDLQVLLQHSLLILQLQADPDELLTPQFANEILFARLQYVQRELGTLLRRRQFYRLGFPLRDCRRIEERRDQLIWMFLASQAYYEWSPTVRCDLLVSIMGHLLEVHELQPNVTSLPKNISEHWEELWQPTLRLWLQGYSPNAMVEMDEVRQYTSSPAEISVLVDDLFGYKAPWGFNALSVYLGDLAQEIGQEIPPVVEYFPALMKYGVHSPAASSFLAFGLESRDLALKLAGKCPDESWDPNRLLAWFVGLNNYEIEGLQLSDDEVKSLLSAQEEARDITGLQTRQRRDWTLTVRVENGILQTIEEGDSLILLTPSEAAQQEVYSIHTPWGDLLGTFKWAGTTPNAWKFPHLIEASVIKKEDGAQGGVLTVQVKEV